MILYLYSVRFNAKSACTSHSGASLAVLKSRQLQEYVITEVASKADTEAMMREGIGGFWIGLRRAKFAFLGGEGSNKSVSRLIVSHFYFVTCAFLTHAQIAQSLSTISPADSRSQPATNACFTLDRMRKRTGTISGSWETVTRSEPISASLVNHSQSQYGVTRFQEQSGVREE